MEAAAAPRALEVLLVDDDADTLSSGAALLQMHGVSTRTASSGLAAIEKVKARCPDVMLLDIGMPGVSGFEVVRALREANICARDPFLVALTGYGEADIKRRCAEEGFDLHLTKPVDYVLIHELLRSLGEVFQQLVEASEAHRAARVDLITARIDMVSTLLDVAATTRDPNTQQRCLQKARNSYGTFSEQLLQDELGQFAPQLAMLEARLRR